jgi:tetratricopeptide (TPR) repeat protein
VTNVHAARVRCLLLCAVTIESVLTAVPLVAGGLQASGLVAQQPQALLERAVADFEAGRIAESAAGFDGLVKALPSAAPQLWQRGITLYYAGRYADCRAQFELHRTVNPDDVENAAWHFLCVARAESAAKARAALLPVGPDARVPMRQIYEMFRGSLSPEQVVQAAGSQASAQFYAQLYVGLYFEALRDDRRALEHITAAAADRYADVGGYMHTVAKVHLGILRRK